MTGKDFGKELNRYSGKVISGMLFEFLKGRDKKDWLIKLMEIPDGERKKIVRKLKKQERRL